MYHIKRKEGYNPTWKTIRSVKEITDLQTSEVADLLQCVQVDACRVYNGAKWVGILALRKLLKR